MAGGRTTTSDSWFACATDNAAAARSLFERGHLRSCISRAYYAAFCAAHALAVKARHTPPIRGNWGHEEIGSVLQVVAATMAGRSVAAYQAQLFDALLSMRRAADYKPKIGVSGHDARIALRDCGRVVRWVEGRLA